MPSTYITHLSKTGSLPPANRMVSGNGVFAHLLLNAAAHRLVCQRHSRRPNTIAVGRDRGPPGSVVSTCCAPFFPRRWRRSTCAHECERQTLARQATKAHTSGTICVVILGCTTRASLPAGSRRGRHSFGAPRPAAKADLGGMAAARRGLKAGRKTSMPTECTLRVHTSPPPPPQVRPTQVHALQSDGALRFLCTVLRRSCLASHISD